MNPVKNSQPPATEKIFGAAHVALGADHVGFVIFDEKSSTIRIQKNAVLTEPIIITHEQSDSTSVITIKVENGAKVTVMYECKPTDGEWNHQIFLLLGAESNLTFAHMSQANAKSQFSSTARAELATGSTLNWHAATLGGNGGTHTLTSNVKGADAVSTVNWVFSARDKEKQAVSVRNVFDARNGGGEITLKGIAEGNGKARCDGMIEITENGTGTNTYLTENVLMLDATAHVDAIPGLEIRTNDVKASHSATVSRITAEDLFYLQSRGIDGDTARTMFVDGFLADLLDRIAEPAVRERFLALVGQSGI